MISYCFYGLVYLLGAIPFGLLFVHWSGRGDVRAIGSGNIGATNVLRTGSKKLALATLLADAGKGTLAVGISSCFDADMYITAFIVVLGHVFSVWLKGKGGKGVATALGAVLVLQPLLGVAMLVTWGVTAKLFRLSSLSALIAFVLSPFYVWIGSFFYPMEATKELLMLTIALAFLIVWTHRSNIKRLVKGTEE